MNDPLPIHPDILAWRTRILRAALLAAMILGGVAYLPSTGLALREGVLSIALANTVALAGIIVLALSQRMSYRVRAKGFLLVVYLLSVALLLVLGPLGAGMIWLFSFPILAAVFLGVGGAVYAMVLTSLSLLGIGVLEAAVGLPWTDQVAPDPLLWLVYAVNFLLLNGAVATCVSLLLKGMEDSVRATTRALEDRAAAERERAVLESRLRQSQKMEALGTLAGGIAHDFNNLLVPIVGNLELASDRIGNPAAARLVEDALQAADRARGLVRSVLAFSRGSLPDRGRVRLADTLDEGQRLLRTALPPGIEIRRRGWLGDAAVLADPVELNQLIVNLGTNAAHAMGDTGVLTLRASVEPGEDSRAGEPDDRVRIEMEDTGCGMDAATLDRAMEPFFTTRPVGGGTGLGLAIVHGIVQSLGGELVLESEPGVGTVARVFLPLLATEQASWEPAAAAPARQGGTERILVVDDDDGARRTVALMLERLGYHVEAASSGEEAVARLGTAAVFDLVITDLSMPGISGIEVARHAARHQPDPIPVLLMTGHMDASLEPTDGDNPIATILTKPFGLDNLARSVRESLPAGRGPGLAAAG